MKDPTLKRILTFFVASFLVIAVVAIFAVRHINRSTQSSDWVNHTYATIYELENIRISLQAGDAAIHSHVFTGDARHLADSRGHYAEMSEHFQIAQALLRENPSARQTLAAFETLADERISFAETLATSRGNPDKLSALLEEDAGRGAIAEINRGLQKLRDEQFALLSERERISYRQAHTTRMIVSTGVGLNLFLFIAVAWLIRDDLNARRRLASVLQEANEQLEAKVQTRTAELVAANTWLTEENLERKWAAQATEHQLRYNQLIVNSVSDLVLVLTRSLTITRINPAVPRRTGWQDLDLLGKPFENLIRISAAEANFDQLQLMAQSLHEGREFHLSDVSVTAKNGTTFAADLFLCPMRDRDKVVGAVAILRSTSARNLS